MRVDDVTTEFVVDDASSRGRVTVFQLTWRSCDPLAVTMELVSRPEHPALPQGVWVAPRDSLRAGLDSPVGDGDVRITPEAMKGRRPAGVRLDLSDGDRQSVVLLEAAPLRSFLDRTESVVPAGEEHPEHKLDEVLDRAPRRLTTVGSAARQLRGADWARGADSALWSGAPWKRMSPAQHSRLQQRSQLHAALVGVHAAPRLGSTQHHALHGRCAPRRARAPAAGHRACPGQRACASHQARQ